jgi:SAM-dependent methyltransferase
MQKKLTLLEKKRKEKDKVRYNLTYRSSAFKTYKAKLGTIENDAAGFYGKHHPEKFRGALIFKEFCKFKFKSVLDIGAGDLNASNEFLKLGKKVDVVELSNSYYFKKSKLINKVYIGDFQKIKFKKKYDAIWCSHVLEHQLNPNLFLKKIYKTIKENGILCIIVPPRKPFIISGHVSLWNGGLLLYHLILAGFDCSKAKLIQYDYNIVVILKKKKINKFPKLRMDVGDLDLISKFFPKKIYEGFNGDIMRINFSLTEKFVKNSK